MAAAPASADPARPTGFARVWEAGRIGAPTRGAAWARCAVTFVVTLVATAGIAVGWSHATYAGAFAVAGLAVVVLAASVTMVLMLYWLHGSIGQVLSGFLLLLFCMLAGGFAVSNAVFTARGEVSDGTIAAFTHRTTLRTSWDACRVRLDDGSYVSRQIRCDRPSVGERVTVTQDPTGLAAPAFGDRTHGSPVLPGVVGAAFLLLTVTLVRATARGERSRLAGTPSPAERPNPGYYPRRLASPEYGSRSSADSD
ncbi:hypothetical protein [Actinacidiphila rubida]|uniref:Uncharacterized protein n=1 Tax=Actinacidiphila rubida TaxID=310780 RepID=A0A1H8DJK0_9ACTN|nr:hypothetical protein [Actinacidiphila rubida]SEN07501.1 hypothetical protein SAMN05216267_1001149 [Actinacidiphila rubida]